MSTMFVRNLFARGIWHWCLLVGLFYLASLRGSAKLSKRSGQVELITIKPELHESTSLNDVLNEIVVDAAAQFQPNNKNIKDLDLDHLARHTEVLNKLLHLHSKAPEPDRAVIRRTIEALQRSLYPWITASKHSHQAYPTFFDLVNSYTQDAGLVISVGKDGGFRWAVHQIVTLRAVLRSTIPIEVFYCGDEDLPKEHREFIQEIDNTYAGGGSITLIDINNRFSDPEGVLVPRGWALRPFAMLASSFKRVILSDADTIFLQDPRGLLKEPTFLEYGSIFWHDRILEVAKEEIYDWADEMIAKSRVKNLDRIKEENPGWFSRSTWYELESGALIIDKTRNLGALLLCCYMNSKKVRDEITYKRFWGDKESYWFSHTLTNSPYHYVPGYAGGMGTVTPQTENADKEHICTSQLVHILESTGEPFWINSGLSQFKWNNDDTYTMPDGWIGHDAEWYKPAPGATRLEQYCVQGPEGPGGIQEPIRRMDGNLKGRFEEMIRLAKTYDKLMENAGLQQINHWGGSPTRPV